MAASWHALLVVAAIPPLSLSLLIFLDLKTEITCGRDYSRFSVFSHVLQKERVVAASRIVLGKVWFKLFYQRPDLHWLYSIHHVFELALTSPNEMLSGTRLAHGRSAIHCEGRSHWAIPSAAPAGSKTWLTWLYFHLHSRQEIEITKRGQPPALLRPWAFHVNALSKQCSKATLFDARYLDLRSRRDGLILVFLYVPSCHFPHKLQSTDVLQEK